MRLRTSAVAATFGVSALLLMALVREHLGVPDAMPCRRRRCTRRSRACDSCAAADGCAATTSIDVLPSGRQAQIRVQLARR